MSDRPFKIKIDDIENDAVSVQLVLSADEQKVVPFSVTYFAMPIVDNTKIGEERLSVTLLSSNGQEAELRLAVFPSDLAADRFDIKELSRELSQRTHDSVHR